MKQSVSFSKKEIESTSLNFSELRDLGLKYIQELSGGVWTDYNAHDPGVTILEQLCYALTDIAYRTSLPVADLLTPGENGQIDSKKNAFLTPSSILSSHPVTIKDTRKLIIDRFDEIQNAWVIFKENKAYEEQLRGINLIEILPKLNFLTSIKSDPHKKEAFLNKVNKFLSENRSLGENFEEALLLEPQLFNIDFDLYLTDQADVEMTIATILLHLMEFIYCPIRFNSFNEMKELGYSMEEAFSGPKLINGFIKNDILKDRVKSIHVDEFQKLFTKVNGVNNCEVKPFIINGVESKLLNVEKGKFFHLLIDDSSINAMDNRFDLIFDYMTVFINNKELPVLNKQKIINLFYETWSKKNRGYPIGKSLNEFFYKKLNGTYEKPDEYYSLQRHFPLIYGIGELGLSKNEPEERRAKALQLKAYLMFFEQHLANHLAQLGNLNEFFNIDYEDGQKKTYFAQWMSSIPGIEKLAKENIPAIESYLEPENIFFNRKNRIYNHLLARFGEDLNDIPWKVSMHLNLVQNENELNRILLHQKSQFLMRLEKLTYNRLKGESFLVENPADEVPKYIWAPSGLEEMILAKTGITAKGSKSLFPDFTEINFQLHKFKEDSFNNREELDDEYRPLRAEEIDYSFGLEEEEINFQNVVFGKIGLKTLFRESLNFKNYKISMQKSPEDNVQVIFQKEKNKWVSLFECSTAENAVRNIGRVRAYFMKQNYQSEGLYIVDHILLSDFLEGSKYGFSFIDEYSSPMFQTNDEESWCDSEEDRYKSLDKFYKFGKENCSYYAMDGDCVIKDGDGKILATYESDKKNPIDSKDELADLCEKNKSFIQFFHEPENLSGRLRFKEMENIRLRGSVLKVNYGQRRLVFQRKLANNKIINEDFFNLNVSVLMPDWPARFQDQRFKAYVTDLLHERIPAHIRNEIIWVNAHEMKAFEEKYHLWEKLRLDSKYSKITQENIASAAYDVYKNIMTLIRK